MPDKQRNVALIGPFREPFKVTSGGYLVPHLTAYRNDDGSITLTVGGDRAAIETTEEDLEAWIPFIAAAMAWAAGYASHGEYSGPDNPFAHRYIGIGMDESPARHKDHLTVVESTSTAGGG